MNLLQTLDAAAAANPFCPRPPRRALLSHLTPEQRRAYWDLRSIKGAAAARAAMGLPSTRKVPRPA